MSQVVEWDANKRMKYDYDFHWFSLCVWVRFDLWTWPIGNNVNWSAEQQSSNEINENRRLTIFRIIISIQQQSICAHETTSTSLLNAIDLFCPRSQLFTFDVNRFAGRRRRRTHNMPHCVNASTMNQTNLSVVRAADEQWKMILLMVAIDRRFGFSFFICIQHHLVIH